MATSDDIYANAHFGYDPSVDEDVPLQAPEPAAQLPPWASVDPRYLPPIRRQITPSCTAWASTYGLATFTAARAGNYSPQDATQQASPSYIYIQVMEQYKGSSGICHGSRLTSYFQLLDAGGTATLAEAPEEPCATLWKDYGGKTLTPEPRFDVGGVAAVQTTDLPAIKAVLASGRALAYGTHLYQDFQDYLGEIVPYIGDGVILTNKTTGKPAGHCMLIVGYDDTVGRGAFHIQNSWGTEWGSSGFVWMAYDTFTALTPQGTAFYVVG